MNKTIVLGALSSAVAFLFFTSFDTLTKVLSQHCSVFMVMAVGYSVGTLLMFLYALVKHRKGPVPTLVMRQPRLHILRGILQIVGQTCAYLALPHVSLAEFYVVIFTMPVLVILIASFALKEHIKPFVWLVLLVNFAGVLVAMRPDQGVNPWMLVLFIGTFVLASALVLLRKMMETETAELTSITTTASLAIGAIVPAIFTFQPIGMDIFMWMLLGGVLCSFAQILLATAYKLAPPAYAGPPQFLQLVYGAIAGYFLLGDVPTLWVYIGGAMVIVANVALLIKRERPQV